MYDTAWLLPISNVALIMVYLMHSAWLPGLRSRHMHANLREEWFDAVSSQAGTEVLAVQTLRNSVMTATMIASTSALGLMGAISLAAPSLRGMLDTNASLQLLTPRNFLGFTLMALLFTTIVMNAMAVRNYTHAGFVVGMPVGIFPCAVGIRRKSPSAQCGRHVQLGFAVSDARGTSPSCHSPRRCRPCCDTPDCRNIDAPRKRHCV